MEDLITFVYVSDQSRKTWWQDIVASWLPGTAIVVATSSMEVISTVLPLRPRGVVVYVHSEGDDAADVVTQLSVITTGLPVIVVWPRDTGISALSRLLREHPSVPFFNGVILEDLLAGGIAATHRHLLQVEDEGQMWANRRAQRMFLANWSRVRPRAKLVLLLAASGLTNKDMMRKLRVSAATITQARAAGRRALGIDEPATIGRLIGETGLLSALHPTGLSVCPATELAIVTRGCG